MVALVTRSELRRLRFEPEPGVAGGDKTSAEGPLPPVRVTRQRPFFTRPAREAFGSDTPEKQKALRRAPFARSMASQGHQAIEYPEPPRPPPFKARTSSTSITSPKPTKQMNDQLAIEPPRNVQSIAVQSPEPRKIMGMERLIG